VFTQTMLAGHGRAACQTTRRSEKRTVFGAHADATIPVVGRGRRVESRGCPCESIGLGPGALDGVCARESGQSSVRTHVPTEPAIS
jgi:hypothetical protein